MSQGNGIVAGPLAKIEVVMLPNGQVQASATGVSPFAIFSALGQAAHVIATQFQEQAVKAGPKIEVADAGLINRIPKG